MGAFCSFQTRELRSEELETLRTPFAFEFDSYKAQTLSPIFGWNVLVWEEASLL
jgi:hypothetical protein